MDKLKGVFIGAFFVIFFVFWAGAEAKESHLYVKVERGNLRDSPKGGKIAEILQSTEMKIVEEKGNWVKVQITGWIWKPSTTPDKTVEFVNYKVTSLPANYSRDSRPQEAHIRAYFQFKNNYDKTLTGLLYKVKFFDMFEDLLYVTSCKDHLSISPGNVNPMDTFRYWEEYPLMAGEPYEKLRASAGRGAIKVEIAIQKAVFIDGSIIEFKE